MPLKRHVERLKTAPYLNDELRQVTLYSVQCFEQILTDSKIDPKVLLHFVLG